MLINCRGCLLSPPQLDSLFLVCSSFFFIIIKFFFLYLSKLFDAVDTQLLDENALSPVLSVSLRFIIFCFIIYSFFFSFVLSDSDSGQLLIVFYGD